MWDIELKQKTTEIANMKTRLKQEKQEFQTEQKDRILREIQTKQTEIEDKKKEIA